MTNSKRILIIDDEPSVLQYLERMLQRLGYAVEITDNGVDGLAKAANPDIALIISDLFMPGDPCELDLIRKLRECRPDCPVVVVSGKPTEDIVKACHDIGVDDFLSKPFELSFIKNVLQKLFPDATRGKSS